VCGLTPAVGLQCSVRVDDVIQTEVHKTLQCSGLNFMFILIVKCKLGNYFT